MTIIFENTDHIKVTDVMELKLDDIVNSISMYNNHLFYQEQANKVFIKIKRIEKKTNFGEDFITRVQKWNDITHLIIENKKIALKWKGNEENELQRSYIDDEDNLIIFVNG